MQIVESYTMPLMINLSIQEMIWTKMQLYIASMSFKSRFILTGLAEKQPCGFTKA